AIQQILFDTLSDIYQENNNHALMVFPENSLLREAFQAVKESQENEIPDNFFEHYLECIMKTNYWFSDAEIRLMADLFNKRVTLLHRDTSNGITSQNGEPFGPDDGEERLIYHEGNHFEAAQITIPL